MKSKVMLGVLAGITLMSVGFASMLTPSNTQAASCSGNDIMYCGFKNPADFAKKYSQNPKGDYDNIYAHFGLAKSELNRFKSTAKYVTVHKNGEIRQGGKLVGTDSYSLGRHKNNSNRKTVTINGKKYYYGTTQTSFASSKLGAYAMFNPLDHSLEFTALTACGNPVWGKSQGYYCKTLNSSAVDRDTYQFWTTPYVKNGAKVIKVVYNFGDGKTATSTNPAQKITHTYAKPGKYTAKVTVYFNYYGRTVTHTRTECTKPIEVKPEPVKPTYACQELTFIAISKNNYRFTLKSTQANGAALTGGNFDFGDGAKATNVTKKDASTVVVDHKYDKPGTYKITATANFNVAKNVAGAKCVAEIKIAEEPVYACQQLSFVTLNKNTYRFTVKSHQANGAVLESANFDFGDGSKAENVTKKDDSTVTVDHKYDKPGKYDITSTLNFNLAKNVAGANCVVNIEIDEEPKECKPGIPFGDKRCEEECKPGIPVGDERCEELPKEVPSTGPAQVIASAFGLGGTIAAGSYYVRTRRDYINTLLNK